MFGGIRYFSYLCNVIQRNDLEREAATRCSWSHGISNTMKNIYYYGKK